MLRLLIDCHGLGYRAHFSLRHLSHDGEPTEVVFGFFSELLRLGERFNTGGFVFCWDGGNERRKAIFPQYKQSREQKTATKEEQEQRAAIHAQFYALREDILPAIGAPNCFHERGYEADDLIAKIILDNPSQQFFIVSSDNDLLQLLAHPNARAQVLLHSGEKITAFQFLAKYGIPARRWSDVKSLAGCSSDGVPGVQGIGTKTAIRILNGIVPPASKRVRQVQRAADLIARNRKLVTLPFPGLRDLQIQSDPIQPDRLFQVFEDLAFESMLTKTMRERWTNVLTSA